LRRFCLYNISNNIVSCRQILPLMQAQLRIAGPGDIAAITNLSTQLGYSVSIHDTTTYLQIISASGSDIVYVALIDDDVIGWIQVSYSIRLESGPFCEITGLVINSAHRRRRIGKLLINKAKEWCLQMNCHKLRVRCNIIRDEAHHFYLNTGFRQVKEQKVFEIVI